MNKKTGTNRAPEGIQWPAAWAPDEGWPEESEPFPRRPGLTRGDVPVAQGTTAQTTCERLGKPMKTTKEGS